MCDMTGLHFAQPTAATVCREARGEFRELLQLSHMGDGRGPNDDRAGGENRADGAYMWELGLEKGWSPGAGKREVPRWTLGL